MTIALATALVRTLYAYLLVGCAFAGWFVAAGVDRLDPVAVQGTRGFRVLIFPGAALLWPVLWMKLARRGRS